MMARRLMTARSAMAYGPLYTSIGSGGAFMMIKADDGFVRPVRVLERMGVNLFYGYVGKDEFIAGSQGEIRRCAAGGGVSAVKQSTAAGGATSLVVNRDRIIHYVSGQWRIRTWAGTDLGLAGLPASSNAWFALLDDGRGGWLVDNIGLPRERSSGARFTAGSLTKTTSTVSLTSDTGISSDITGRLCWRVDEGPTSPLVSFPYPSDGSLLPPPPPGSEMAAAVGRFETWLTIRPGTRRLGGSYWILASVIASELRLGPAGDGWRRLSLAQRRSLVLLRLEPSGPVIDRVISRETWYRPWADYRYTPSGNFYSIAVGDHPVTVSESYGPLDPSGLNQYYAKLDYGAGKLFVMAGQNTQQPRLFALDILDPADIPAEIAHPLAPLPSSISAFISLDKEGVLVVTSRHNLSSFETEEWHSPDKGATWVQQPTPQFIPAGATYIEPLYAIDPPPPPEEEEGDE